MKFVSNKLARAQPLLGTFVEITASGRQSSELEAAIEAAFSAVRRVHGLMSFHDPASDVSRINNATIDEIIVVDDWTYEVLEASADFHSRSNGRFNVGIARALQVLGLLPRGIHAASIRTPLERRNVFELLPGKCVRMAGGGGMIDLGGIAKGFAVDRAIDALKNVGIPNGLVNAGGDLATFGSDNHVVGIRDPRDPSRLICSVAMQNAAIASSALLFDPLTSERQTQSAVIHPESGQPVRSICGATVRAPSCMAADALTKVVMIAGTGSSEALNHYGASALFVADNGVVQVTVDWQGVFSIAA
jgi:FAD:protein FMN transferase